MKKSIVAFSLFIVCIQNISAAKENPEIRKLKFQLYSALENFYTNTMGPKPADAEKIKELNQDWSDASSSLTAFLKQQGTLTDKNISGVYTTLLNASNQLRSTLQFMNQAKRDNKSLSPSTLSGYIDTFTQLRNNLEKQSKELAAVSKGFFEWGAGKKNSVDVLNDFLSKLLVKINALIPQLQKQMKS